VTQDDALYRFRLRVPALATELLGTALWKGMVGDTNGAHGEPRRATDQPNAGGVREVLWRQRPRGPGADERRSSAAGSRAWKSGPVSRGRPAPSSPEELQYLFDELLVVLEDAAVPGVGVDPELCVRQTSSHVG
jgi:hypothetical protein